MNIRASWLLAAMLLTGCSSAPPPPDWKMNTVSLLEHYQTRWLEGDSKAADLALDKSRKELSKTGRLDLLARLELAACGTRIAALDFSACTAYTALDKDAAPAEQAYEKLLSGQWEGLDGKALPAHYAALVAAKDDAAANKAMTEIRDPLPRLIAAGLLFRQGRAMPGTQVLAAETASERGWRRPLLTWLEVRRKAAEQLGDKATVEQLRRRITFIEKQGIH